MDWFTGSIPEAISKAKSKKCLFIVLVYDKSDLSERVKVLLNEERIQNLLKCIEYIAIQLENGSEPAVQFSQIYPLIVVPSLFFISGESGVPLEILGGVSSEELINKLKKLAPSMPSTSESSAITVESSELDINSCSETNAIQNSEPILEDEPTKKSEDVHCLDEDDTQISLEEKVERAKELLAQKKLEKVKDEEEEEKLKEIDRRKMGREIGEIKKKRKEDEIKAAADDRRREREEDRIAREKVRAQIALDRADREARAALLRGEQPTSTESKLLNEPLASTSKSNSNVCRIKFRLPDGSSSLAQFSADAALSSAFSYVEENIKPTFGSFSLTSTFSQHSFTEEDSKKSLRELSLVPSAIIIVTPKIKSRRRVNAVSSSAGGGFIDMIWMLTAPFLSIFHWILRFAGFSNSSSSVSRKRDDHYNSASNNKRSRTEDSELRMSREGNIHRINNFDDESDDENTWNGNSTQQK